VGKNLRADDEVAYQRKLAALVRSMRRHVGITQRELADIAGTAQSHVSDIETGTVGVGLFTLKRIAEACGYSFKIVIERRYEA
jgi:predicted transcriptional regulator